MPELQRAPKRRAGPPEKTRLEMTSGLCFVQDEGLSNNFETRLEMRYCGCKNVVGGVGGGCGSVVRFMHPRLARPLMRLHRMAMHDNTSVVITQKYTTRWDLAPKIMPSEMGKGNCRRRSLVRWRRVPPAAAPGTVRCRARPPGRT
jgi:hypothetical protein